MAITEKSLSNLIPARKGDIRNPKGKPKGTIHINTIVQELMLDPKFNAWIHDPKEGYKKLEGIPAKAIVKAQMLKALQGDTKAYDSLVKSGWAAKAELDLTSNGETVGQPIDENLLTQFLMNIQENTKR